MEARDPFCLHFQPFNIASLSEHLFKLSMSHFQRAMPRIFCLDDRNGGDAVMSALRVNNLSDLVVYFTYWLTKSSYRSTSPAKTRRRSRSRSPVDSSPQAQDQRSGKTEQKCKREQKKEGKRRKEGRNEREKVRGRKSGREEERQGDRKKEYKKEGREQRLPDRFWGGGLVLSLSFIRTLNISRQFCWGEEKGAIPQILLCLQREKRNCSVIYICFLPETVPDGAM